MTNDGHPIPLSAERLAEIRATMVLGKEWGGDWTMVADLLAEVDRLRERQEALEAVAVSLTTIVRDPANGCFPVGMQRQALAALARLEATP